MQSLRLNRRLAIPAVALSIVGFGVLVAIIRPLTIVPAGYVGIVDTFGQFSDRTLPPGIHLKNPFANVVKFSTQTREIKETAEAPSKDGLTVSVDVSILYRLDPAKARQLYQTVGRNYEQVIVIPQFRSMIRAATATYEAKTLYTSQRQALSQRLRQELSQVVAPRGILVEDTPLRKVTLPESIQKSVQAKLQAEQESQRMEFVLQKERQEAERKRIEAKGVADSQRIISGGLNDRLLQFRQIEAMEKLAQSQNTKVVVTGSDQKTSMILQP